MCNFATKMAKDAFQFRQFVVHQDRCAMKVGTDGTLLGAWADVPEEAVRLLDVGTGTGLIALMLAQRFPGASVTAIDIDPSAVEQASENVAASPFASRIEVMAADICQFDTLQHFDAIVCNPPFFENALHCPDAQRAIARHTTQMTYWALMHAARRLLTEAGRLSVIIPDNFRSRMASEAALQGLFLTRQFAVRTTPQKLPRRYLLEFRKTPVDVVVRADVVLETKPHERSTWYQSIMQDFYIK